MCMGPQHPKFFTPRLTKSGVETDGEETGYIPHNGFVRVLREKIIQARNQKPATLEKGFESSGWWTQHLL